MAITTVIGTLPAVLPYTPTYFEDISNRNNSLVTVTFPSINTWATEANALAVTLNTASTNAVNAASISMAAANFKGVYNPLTAYTVPSSILYLGTYYLAIASSTGQTPPNVIYWAPVYSMAFADLIGKPTTIAGYGITDAYTKSEIGVLATLVHADSATGAAIMPKGTTAERPVIPTNGYMRYNTDLNSMEVYSTATAAWGSVGGGATGGGTDHAFMENDQVITANYTLTANKNAISAGPISINTGVTVSIPSGATWTIV